MVRAAYHAWTTTAVSQMGPPVNISYDVLMALWYSWVWGGLDSGWVCLLRARARVFSSPFSWVRAPFLSLGCILLALNLAPLIVPTLLFCSSLLFLLLFIVNSSFLLLSIVDGAPAQLPLEPQADCHEIRTNGTHSRGQSSSCPHRPSSSCPHRPSSSCPHRCSRSLVRTVRAHLRDLRSVCKCLVVCAVRVRVCVCVCVRACVCVLCTDCVMIVVRIPSCQGGLPPSNQLLLQPSFSATPSCTFFLLMSSSSPSPSPSSLRRFRRLFRRLLDIRPGPSLPALSIQRLSSRLTCR
jgi:hypothetical protein